MRQRSICSACNRCYSAYNFGPTYWHILQVWPPGGAWLPLSCSQEVNINLIWYCFPYLELTTYIYNRRFLKDAQPLCIFTNILLWIRITWKRRAGVGRQPPHLIALFFSATSDEVQPHCVFHFEIHNNLIYKFCVSCNSAIHFWHIDGVSNVG